MTTIKLAIVGSRTYKNYKQFSNIVDNYIKFLDNDNIQIVSGGANGADTLAEKYAKENNYTTIIYKPDWQKYGKIAGILRNTYIAEECTHLIAFPSKEGRGTQDTIKKIKKMNKPHKIFYID